MNADDLIAQYRFDLPDDRIARFPPADRSGGRMLVLADPPLHQRIVDLPEALRAGDLLVVNDTRVVKARLSARRASGGRVEVLLLGVGPGPVEALVRPGRKLKPGERVAVDGGGEVVLHAPLGDGRWRVETTPEPLDLMEQAGALPLPHYMERPATEDDEQRYQTVFARSPGAVAAPTAGLHLSPPLLERLAARGVGVTTITLHVGLGTFRPLRPDDVDRGELHREWYEVTERTRDAVAACRASGGRVIAVGTTSCRTLEAAADADGVPRAGSGVTGLFIREGHRFRGIDGLLTNFHLPESSLLMLVCALGGRERVLSAYREAIALGYRFYSYGDAMLLLPDHRQR